MATYKELKDKVIEIIDDFAESDNVKEGYGKKDSGYNASTKLEDIGITQPVLIVMPKRFNKVMRELVGSGWRVVGPIDMGSLNTIADMIKLACGQSGIWLPKGEPE
ncbi:MAG: hypothetical protein HGA99_04895 [Chlorobiaceae bacterium]|nr:hypothetical protein [Chlorobiaceae bacterium]